MKTICTFLLCLVAMCTQAQALFEKRMFRMGVNLVETTGPLSETIEKSLGQAQLKPVFNLGFGGDIRLTTNIHLHVGAQYQPRGYAYKLTSTDSTYTKTNLVLHYLDVPLSLALTAGGKKARVKPYIEAGVYAGIGLFGRNKRSGQIINPKTKLADSTFTESSKVFGEQVKQIDYGLNLSAGIQTRMVQFGVTYGMGLNNISLQKGEAIRNRTYGLFMNILFDDWF